MNFRIFSEGGYSCQWFTELEIVDDSHVKILAHYRLHWDEYNEWPDKNKTAIRHPMNYGCDLYKESDSRIATHYNLPLRITNDITETSKCKWCEIVNPQYIFSYLFSP